ncbi:hypothetical protein quinque_002789 [Culex quinquefasciatus]
MVVQIKVNELSIGVAVLYNPSCTNPNFSQHYEKVLLDMLDFGFDRTYIVGDFNINVAAGSPSVNLTALHRIHAAFNLTVLHTGPTRITDTSSTTIDLLITDGPLHIKKAKATSVSNISDHEVVYLVADIRVHRTCQRTIRARNFRNIDQLQLQADFQAKDLRRLFGSADINEKATVLNSELTSLLDAHAPERTVTIRDERTPWITQQIKEAQNFFSAWRKCIDRKLELATIESLEDNLAFEAALGSYREQVYTSGTDMGKEGSFVWLVNKRVIPGWNNFEAWETGEPNNNAGNENCLVGIVKGGRVQWNDIPCNNEYCYMCQDILT